MHNPTRIARGAGLIVAAVALFALLDTITKHLAQRLDVGFIMLVRYAVNLALLLAIYGRRNRHALFRTERTALVLLRAAALVAASLLMGLALRLLPLGEAVAILYTAPVLVVLTATPLLGERLRPIALVAAGLGLAGVIMIARPGAGMALTGVGLALGAAVMNAAYQLLSRDLARTETTMALLMWAALSGTVAFGIGLPWTLPAAMPAATDVALLFGMGLIGTLGHMLFTAAYREAPASVLAPLNYVHLLWAALFGWLFLGDLPDATGAAGMGLIALAGIAVALVGRRGVTGASG